MEITLTISESCLDSLALGAILVVLFIAVAGVMIAQSLRGNTPLCSPKAAKATISNQQID